MSKKRSKLAKTNAAKTGQFVRFYFTLAIDYVLPENPKKDNQNGKRCSITDDEWVTECCKSIGSTIETKLAAEYDGVSLKHYERHTNETNVFTIYFVISRLHSFNATDIFSPKKGYVGFKIKARPMSLAEREIKAHIYNSLCYDYYISDLSIKFVTSRSFAFEIYFGGSIVVERIFSAEEIREEEGVSNALERWSGDMESALTDFYIWPLTKTRRSRDNRYVFEISASRILSFGENEVVGDLTSIDRDMDIDEVIMFGIDNRDDALDTRISYIQDELDLQLIDLPEDVKVVSFEINFIDQDDDVYEVCDELVKDI